MGLMPVAPNPEVTDLLQSLIRNACVNDGTPGSGQEARNATLLRSYLEGHGLDIETFEPSPGRLSLVARMDPPAARAGSAPTLALMGHTDVVPANPDGWRHDPFGGELVDGEVWGRGAVDMLNLTASMAVAVRNLARSGFAPSGGLVYLAVADEEALGTNGAAWLTEHAPEAVKADYLVTESGGTPIPTRSGVRLPVVVGEKGTWWCTLRVRGTPGHASQPFRTDNALVKAAEVVQRLARLRPPARIGEVWRRYVSELGLPEELTATLTDPAAVWDECQRMRSPGLARQAHACTHTTIAPTVVHGGTKTNVIPDRVDVQLDVRTLPGQSGDEVRSLITEALGDLAGDVTITSQSDDESSESPVDTPLWEALQRLAARLHPGSRLVPSMMTGATDARFFRRMGVPSYGFGLFSTRTSYEQYASMFHGDDERVDVESLALSTELWESLARDFVG